jgi:L-iditol 2-dehydrogenase
MSMPTDLIAYSANRATLPLKMRAGVYRGAGNVATETVPVPEIGKGEVLIRVAACGICGTDLKKIQHGFIKPPQIFGHEVAGTIAGVGEDVRHWKEGDRVVSFHHVPCGACFYCDRRLFSQCASYKKVGLTAGFEPNGGGFAEYVRAMPWIVQRGMVKIPAGISFEEATFVEPVNTCLKAVEKARVEAGDSVVVIGQGPIGLLLMLLVRRAGARVFTTDPMGERRAVSESLGAAATFDPRSCSVAEEVRKLTSGRGADVVLVAVPIPAALSEALATARPGGRVLLFAQNDPHMKIEFAAAEIGVEEKEILGSYSAAVDRQEESANLVFSRALPVSALITHRFSLEEFGTALSLAARPNNSLKILVIP